MEKERFILEINFDSAGEPHVLAWKNKHKVARWCDLLLIQDPDDPYTFECEQIVDDGYDAGPFDDFGVEELRVIAKKLNILLRRKYPSLTLFDVTDVGRQVTFLDENDYILFRMLWSYADD